MSCFMNTLLKSPRMQVGSKYLVETLQKVEELVSSVVEVLSQSAFFSMVLKSYRAFSLLSNAIVAQQNLAASLYGTTSVIRAWLLLVVWTKYSNCTVDPQCTQHFSVWCSESLVY